MNGGEASEAEPAEEEKVGLVARLRRRLKRGAKAADADAEAADNAPAAPPADVARTGGQDSDVEAEEAELYARRPLVRVVRPAFCNEPRAELRVQPLEGPVDRSTENGLLASQPCRAVRRRLRRVRPPAQLTFCLFNHGARMRLL